MSSSNSPQNSRERAHLACRKLFGQGVARWVAEERLTCEFGLSEEEARECFEGVFREVRDEFVEFCKCPEWAAVEVYRGIRNGEKNSWSVRLRAQVAIDELLDLPTAGQEPDGQENGLVLEAYDFYRLLLSSGGPNQHQRMRAQQRLMLLACGRSRRARNRPARSKLYVLEERLRRGWKRELQRKAVLAKAEKRGEVESPAAERADEEATSNAVPTRQESRAPEQVELQNESSPRVMTQAELEAKLADPRREPMRRKIRAALQSAPPGADLVQVAAQAYADWKNSQLGLETSLSGPARQESRPSEGHSPAAPVASGAAGQSSSHVRDLKTPDAQPPPRADVA